MKFFTAHLLKNKQEVFKHALDDKLWNRILGELLLVSFIGFALFGVAIASQYPEAKRIFELSWKMIALMWGSIALCAPSLYVFSSLRSSNLTARQVLYIIVAAMATSGVVLLALVPISWFFTWTTSEVGFIQVMNAAMVGLSTVFGLLFLGKAIIEVHKMNAPESTTKPAVDVLLVWLVLFLVVAAQMSQKLGPWYHRFAEVQVLY